MTIPSSSSSPATRWDAELLLPDPRADREVTWLHRIEAAAARAMLSWSKRQGIDQASARLGAFCRRAGPWLGAVHRRGLANLGLTMPDLPVPTKEAILRDEWENLGRTAAEFAHMEQLADRTTIEGGEQLEAILASGRPCVFVSGHFANWETMAIVLHRAGLKTAVVYRAANNPLVDRMIIERRAAVMSRRLIPKGKRGGRELMSALADGLSLCMLTDQKLSDGIDAPLLGVPARTAPAAARLALKADLPVVPLQIRRTGGAHFAMTVHEPIAFAATGDKTADARELTVLINDALSRFIEDMPGQWLWFHRRWPKDARPAAADIKA